MFDDHNLRFKFILSLLFICALGWVTTSSQARKTLVIPHNLYPNGLLGYTNGRHYIKVKRRLVINCHATQIDQGYIQKVIRSEYKDINNARQDEEVRPLIQNRNLVRLANWRAKQVAKHFSHYTNYGFPLAWRDAQKMRLGKNRQWPSHNIGENMCKVGKLNHIHEPRHEACYYFSRPQDLSGANVFDLVNNDSASHYDHAFNIMWPKNRYFGIGTSYDSKRQVLYIMSEFSRRYPAVGYKKQER